MGIVTLRHDRQLAKHRADFERALKISRCPKDKGHILEVNMPYVVCERCSTRYILAMQSGALFMRWKLQEEQNAQALVKEKEVIQGEVVKIPCSYCGALVNEVDNFCKHCGAPRQGLRRMPTA